MEMKCFNNHLRETIWKPLSPDPRTGDYPLIVTGAGHSHWQKGAVIERRECDLFTLEVVVAGNLVYVQNGKEYLVEPGEIFLQQLRSNHRYETGPAGFTDTRFVSIEGELLPDLQGVIGLNDIDVCRISSVSRFSASSRTGYRLLTQCPLGYLDDLALLAYKILLFMKHSMVGRHYPTAISCSLGYINRNLHRKITVEELAEASAVSSSHLFRLFQNHLSTSPVQLIIDTRMRHAAQLLQRTDMSVKEIGQSLGYDEPAYFTRQFRRQFGVSPREYRRNPLRSSVAA